jgi:hypothetical protein
MKRIFTLIALVVSYVSYGQHLYVKALPTYFVSRGYKPNPGGIAAIGVALSRYAKGGIGAGYHKIDGLKGGFTLIGADISVCDFKRKKVLPIIHTSAYYPIHNSTYKQGDIEYNTKGKFQIQFSAGVSLPMENYRIIISGGVSDLLYTTTTKTPTSKNEERTVRRLFLISAGILF